MHTSSAAPALRHLETPEEWRACLPLMRELRPHLAHADDFVQRLTRMHQENYRLLAVMRDGLAVALAGYRYQENLLYGRFMYVDDLVVDPSARGSRWGARLIAELDQLARGADCDEFVLDTGLGNALAQRFYFRQGLLTSAIRFSKPLKGTTQ